jgi:2-octaprenyl-6-methoxyphenol hydroxylase
MAPAETRYDVLIAGGGPAGGALALALRGSGLRIAVLESRPRTGDDPRPLALSHGSRLILERLELWRALEPVTPINRIHVSQRGGFGRVVLDAAAVELPALGYVVDYTRLATVVTESLQGGWCDYLPATAVSRVSLESDLAVVELETAQLARRAATRLLVVADGGMQSDGGDARAIRTVDYRQTAVTARVTSTLAHAQVAYERFTPEGPLALLPADMLPTGMLPSGNNLALVWSMTPERAQRLCAAPESEFLVGLQQAFGNRLGRFTAAARRGMFPLALRVARDMRQPRTARIGNAAQTLHPVAGQGLNLGLRDAWELADELRRVPLERIGEPGLLARYSARRRLDRGGGIWFTHCLARVFSGDDALLRCARGLGLAALAALPPAQDFLVRRMNFGARG